MSEDMERVTATAAEGADQIAKVFQWIEDLELNMGERLDYQELARLVEQLKAVKADHKLDESQAETAAERKILFLLNHISDSGLTFRYEGKERPASWVWMKLYAKYLYFGGSAITVDDFIENVAGQTTEGELYYVVETAGEERPMRDWLREAMTTYTDEHSIAPEEEQE